MVLNESKRIAWLDILKGIGIFYVVLGHVDASQTEFLAKHINSFHMPLFFLISGFLFNAKKYDSFKYFFIKKVKTLLVPYFIFGLIGMAFAFLLSFNGSIFNIKENILGLLTYDPWNGPIWFLTCLFIMEIVYYWIDMKLPKKPSTLVIVMLMAIGLLMSQNNGIHYFWRFNIALTMMPFLHIGKLINENYESLKINLLGSKYKLIFIMTISFIVNIIFSVFMNIKAAVSGAIYGNFFFFFISSLAGIIFYFCVSVILSEFNITSKIMSYFGKNSLVIMSIHWMLIRIVLSVFVRLFGFQNIMISTVLIMIVSVPIINIINKYLPFILGAKINGKEKINEGLNA